MADMICRPVISVPTVASHGHGPCCDSMYRNSLGRNDDTMFDDEVPGSDCFGIGEECKVGEGACFPGLGLSGNLYVTHR